MHPYNSIYHLPWIFDNKQKAYFLSRVVSATFGVEGSTIIINGMLIHLGTENTIDSNTAKLLEKNGFLIQAGSSLFFNQTLNQSIFSWDRSAEISFLMELIRNKLDFTDELSILDLGCGWGDILLHLSKIGIKCSGVDENSLAVSYLRDKGHRAFVASITNFIDAVKHDMAFAAMNTLRYLPSKSDLRLCLVNVAQMVRKDGLFVFQVTLDTQSNWYVNRWKGDYLNRNIIIVWEKEYQTMTHIVDKISVIDNDKWIHQERQNQLFFSSSLLIDSLRSVSKIWRLESTFNNNFESVCGSIPVDGTHWFVLRRL